LRGTVELVVASRRHHHFDFDDYLRFEGPLDPSLAAGYPV